MFASLLVVQMTLCAFVLFAALLFQTTFNRLSSQSFGFSYDHVLAVDADMGRDEDRAHRWGLVADAVSRLPGVRAVAVAGWPLLSYSGWTNTFGGGDAGTEAREEHCLGVSPGFFHALEIPLLAGRDFRATDSAPGLDAASQPHAGVGIVNEAFARRYFDGRSPVGRRVLMRQAKDVDAPLDIVGVVADTAYRGVREPMRPIVFLPYGRVGSGTLLVRTAGEPLALAGTIGRLIHRKWPEIRVRQLRPATDLIETQMVVERLLARLTGGFALLVLLLAGIGLYGVVNDGVLQRRREIGLRMALGARAPDIVRHVTAGAFVLACVGLTLGLGGGVAFGRVVSSLLFRVTPTDAGALATPLLVLAAVFLLASMSPALRAVRTNPTETLRSE